MHLPGLVVLVALQAVPPPAVRQDAPISASFQRFAAEHGYDPRAHREVLRYFRKLWAGEPRDPAFEGRTTRDLDFKLLNFAELIVAMCREIDLPVDKAVEFISITTSPTPLPEGIVTRAVAALFESNSEEARARQILTATETKGLATLPIVAPLDRVEMLLRYSVAVERWSARARPSRFPGFTVVADPSAPAHMRTRNAEDVRHYHERRRALGKPWEEPAALAVARYLAYEIGLARNRSIPVDAIAPTQDLRGDLGFDDLAVGELILGLEEHYDAKIRFADAFSPQTVGAVIAEIEKQLPRK